MSMQKKQNKKKVNTGLIFFKILFHISFRHQWFFSLYFTVRNHQTTYIFLYNVICNDVNAKIKIFYMQNEISFRHQWFLQSFFDLPDHPDMLQYNNLFKSIWAITVMLDWRCWWEMSRCRLWFAEALMVWFWSVLFSDRVRTEIQQIFTSAIIEVRAYEHGQLSHDQTLTRSRYHCEFSLRSSYTNAFMCGAQNLKLEYIWN